MSRKSNVWCHQGRITNDYLQGGRLDELGVKYGTTGMTIKAIVVDKIGLDEYNVHRKSHLRKKKEHNVWKIKAKISDEWMNGSPIKSLSEKYGCHVRTVKSVIIDCIGKDTFDNLHEELKRKNRSKILMGKTSGTSESITRASNKRTGSKRSKETKDKMSESATKRYKNPSKKLEAWNHIDKIKQMKREHLTYKQIGEIYNCSASTIRAIVNHKRC